MRRVLVVDDSAFARKALTRVLGTLPGVRVVGEAPTAEVALALLPRARPDLVTLDVDLPGMDGLAALRALLRERPGLQVIMVSARTRAGAELTLEALALGAADFIDKASLNLMDLGAVRASLQARLEALAGAPPAPEPRPARLPAALARTDWGAYELCVLGASTGGPRALEAIFRALPATFPLPVLAVQHMPEGFLGPFAQRLDRLGRLRVAEARGGERLEPGRALLGPIGLDLVVRADRTVALAPPAPDAAFVPSVDALMSSAARALPGRVVGVLLTGMGSDGAEGLGRIRASGGLTVAESAESCVVYGMPRAAHERGAVEHLLALDSICALLAGAGPPSPWSSP